MNATPTFRHPFHALGEDFAVDVEIFGILGIGWGIGILPAPDFELKLQGVFWRAQIVRVLLLVRELSMIGLQWNQSQSVCENLILDERGVVVDVNLFDGHGGDVADQDSPAEEIRVTY